VTGVGIWLLGIGIADLVAGMSGEPKGGRRTLAAIVVAFLVPLGLTLALTASTGTAALLPVITGASFAGWIALRREPRGSAGTRAMLALLYLVAVFVVVSIVGTEPISSFETAGAGARALSRLPFPRIAHTPIEQVVLVAGVVVALFATSNAIVRLVLTAADTEFSSAEQRLRGGRIIGPIERVLIFGLGLAGEPTAAALVIGAKGLLRYPELSGLRADAAAVGSTVRPIDVVTEYLLIGSLTSWGLALLPLIVVP